MSSRMRTGLGATRAPNILQNTFAALTNIDDTDLRQSRCRRMTKATCATTTKAAITYGG